MPRNGSGTMAIINEFSPSTTISSSKVNANFSDVADELTNSLPRDGQAAMTAALQLANGTVSAPGLAFGSDTNTGIYRIGADNIGVAANGAKVLDISTTGLSITGTLTPSGQIVSSAGDKTNPGYSFSGDLDTGIYRIGANNIGISAGDTKIVDISTTGVAITGTFGFSGDFAINTNKFTVEASSGNTAIAGTLAVTGASQFTGQATFDEVPDMPMVITYQRLAATPYTATDTLGSSYVIANDGSTPEITEGFEILTKAITPLSNTHIVRVKVNGFAFASGTSTNVTVALFRNSTFINGVICGSNSVPGNFSFEYDDAPSTTSEVTYSVRVGSHTSSSTLAVNRGVLGAIGGSKSTMVLEELGPTPS